MLDEKKVENFKKFLKNINNKCLSQSLYSKIMIELNKFSQEVQDAQQDLMTLDSTLENLKKSLKMGEIVKFNVSNNPYEILQ